MATAVDTQKIDINDLEEIVFSSITALGHEDSDARLIAELRGNNQGLAKIPAGAIDPPKRKGNIEIANEGSSVQVWNGNGQFGMVVLQRATERAIELTKQNGSSAIGTNNTSTTTGALGYHTERIARAGYIGIALSQSPEMVAPHGASEPIFGTNPIAISVPTGEGQNPITFDMATSAMAWYGMLELKSAGKSLPTGIAFDGAGQPTTDPASVVNGGALKNFTGDHKGSGLSFMIELLAGALVGGAIKDKMPSKNWGNLVVSIDPSLFGAASLFSDKVQELVDRVKGARKEEGVSEILIPGERGSRASEKNRAANSVTIETSLLDALRKLSTSSINV